MLYYNGNGEEVNPMIERVEYMNALKKWRGEKVIKVVTGF